MNKALLDTDTLSEMAKGVDRTVASHARAYRSVFGRSAIAAVTLMEVVRGYQKKQATRQLQSFLAAMAAEEVIPFDQVAAELAGRVAGDPERAGLKIGVANPMIAAIAMAHGLELVTGNTGHFERIRQLGHPLILVNWRK